ncbi:excisionase [Dulcicalothrix desertica PCC 7102]|uniref:Excisionase n=1 Tax=Dulcicalothrix desertica PCC 7102 TaxID=232991 RepID=A0A3S1J925_9CYAN|nr:helix-turn-helix domain-containing protein [Dulcicalothrix desertica]RUT09969.1 excisionase [Dulcicalothrix desertica PCC 7102]TWH41050.1 excisionase family DNA binding protein [Dulcicalothrix desertica PCC 7102]
MLSENEPIQSATSQDEEIKLIKQLEKVLRSGSQSKIHNNGEQVVIPESVLIMWHQVVHAMALGQTVSIVPQQQEMTTQEAADFLNVSRPYLIKLLEQGQIPYIKVGSHRRVNLLDLSKYKEERDKTRREGMKEFSKFLQEEGFYD